MFVLPVLDLLSGAVVRGVAGDRGNYRPVESLLCGDARPVSVARAFVKLGLREAYVADLDAIAGREPAWDIYLALIDCGLSLWIDAGAGDAPAAERLASFGHAGQSISRIVVGLESLAGRGDLSDVLAVLGPERAVFSLDLKHGRPLTESPDWRDAQPFDIAAEAVAAGAEAAIVLDLAQVGVGRGPATLDVCRRLRAAFPRLELIGGGGLRNADDLRSLADAGCDAALVASALHDGRLTAADVAGCLAPRHRAVRHDR